MLCCNLKHKFREGLYSFGNLRELPFEEIWRGEVRHSILRKVEGDANFLKNVCMYCRMNGFNEILGRPDVQNVSDLWRFI